MPFIRVTPSGGTELRNFSLTSAKYRIGGGGERFKREGHRRAAPPAEIFRRLPLYVPVIRPRRQVPVHPRDLVRRCNVTSRRVRKFSGTAALCAGYKAAPSGGGAATGLCSPLQRNFAPRAEIFRSLPLLVPVIRPHRRVLQGAGFSARFEEVPHRRRGERFKREGHRHSALLRV